MQTLDAERGFVLLEDEDSAEGGRSPFDVRASRNFTDGQLDGVQALSTSVVSEVLRTGEPVLVYEAPPTSATAASESVVLQKIQSIACVPLRLRSRQIGAIYLDSVTQRGRFTRDNLPFLRPSRTRPPSPSRTRSAYQTLRDENRQLRQRGAARPRLRRDHRPERRGCARCSRPSAACSTPTRRCSSKARAGRAKSSSPARSTTTATRKDEAVRRHLLRLAPGRPPGVRALRPPQGRVHRRGGRQEGPLRSGRRRDHLPRRGRRPQPEAPDGAAARAPDRRDQARRRHRDAARGRPRSSRRRTGLAAGAHRGRRLPRGPLLPPQHDPRSSCRRCATAAATSRCWRTTSSTASPTGSRGRTSAGSAPRRSTPSSATAGPATSASWRTPSSGPSSSRADELIAKDDLRLPESERDRARCSSPASRSRRSSGASWSGRWRSTTATSRRRPARSTCRAGGSTTSLKEWREEECSRASRSTARRRSVSTLSAC